MKDVIICIRAIEFLAKDVHYRSSDEWFYALHLLADKVDFGSAVDDLNEAYFMGFRLVLPPTEKEIYEEVVKKCADVRTLDNKALITALQEACMTGVLVVEAAKHENGLPSGVHAILDGISQTMLTIKGLCWRSVVSLSE